MRKESPGVALAARQASQPCNFLAMRESITKKCVPNAWYAESVRDLTESAALVLGHDVELLRRACWKAWEQAERARVALVRHEGNHFCDQDYRGAKVRATAAQS